ncbi:MAG: hypothetical protein ACKVQJ_06075 [Pyrinomonadaceae bacterium]
MLIDEFLSEYDFVETHDISISAGTANVYRAMQEVDFCESTLVRWLFFLRGLPSDKVTIRDVKRFHFKTLGEIVNKELLIGLAGRFWTVMGDLQDVNADNFKAFDKSGYAKAVWNFSVDADGENTRLTTETRIRCLDDDSRRSFGFYWTFIRPFSGLIRTEMLKTIKKRAETSG